MRSVRLLMLFGFLLVCHGTSSFAAEPKLDFDRDVRPIFVANCLKCHGAEKNQGGLRLDRRQHAFGPTDSGTPVLVPGKPDQSELLRRVSSEDESERMPPEGDPLTVTQVGVLRSWIASGAVWPADKAEAKHWAWTAPVRPALPPVKNTAWVNNPIDQFIAARLEKEGLSPAPQADPAVLCRRLYLDLTGLPPTPEEVNAFISSVSPSLPLSVSPSLGKEGEKERQRERERKAVEALVDKLLASPQFGERWARHWLDLARYADSNGFQRDGFRSVWAYRDWVVGAFNRDLPYTQFAIEQIAGDLLPDATDDTRIATGFNRCTTVNVEAGTDPEENRVLAVVDRVNTTATVFLGATLACAQCHNHKYDPFTQVDYYRLLAYFNSTEAEITPRGSARVFSGPSLSLPIPAEQTARKAALEEQIKALEGQLVERTALARDMERELAARVKQPRAEAAQWHVLTPISFESAGGATPVTLDDNSVLLTEDRPDKDVYTVIVRTDLQQITGFKLEALTDDSLPGKGPGRGDAERPNFVLSEFVVQAAPQSDPTGVADVGLAGASADFSQADHDPSKAIDGKIDRTGWAINPKFHEPHHAIFYTRQPVGHEDGTVLTFRLHQNFGTSRTIGRLRLSAMTGAHQVAPLPESVLAALGKPAAKRTKSEVQAIEEYCLSLDPLAQEMRDKLSKSQKELAGIEAPSSLVMIELDQPRTTAVMKRGNFLDLGPQVKPGTPAALHPLPPDAPANRLGLARWLADERNPLLARVAVNRFWAELFGRGIVATPEDFGTQAEPPTHPELLDWLAVEFSQGPADRQPGPSSGPWSMKHLLRTIVLSATYQQSSSVSPLLLKRDPYNLLYARGARFRLPAETIRDNALTAAGLLSRKLGGPPVYPPQPEGIWRVTGEVDNNYYTSAGEDRYRRGLYTIWRRSGPYPSFVNFDAPDRSSCVISRPRTNTPLQALTLLNDPVYVEAAGALARRMMAEAQSADAASRIEHGFRLLLAREPKAIERELLTAAYAKELESFRADAKKTAKVLAAAKLEAKDGAAAELAALLQMATLLLNLDETITKG